MVGTSTTIRPSTFECYSMHVEAYLKPALGGIPLQKLSAAALNALYRDLLDHGRKGGGPLSPRSVRLTHTIARKALADALRLGYIARNVADLSTPPRQRTRREMSAWSAEQARAFLDSTREDRVGIAWRLLLATGVRRGELLGLRWSDVDLDGARLSITRAVVNVGHVATPSEPKTARGRRTIALDVATVAALRTWKAKQGRERLKWGTGYVGTDLVICREDGSPVHPERLTRWFEQAVARSGLPSIRLHDLRHTHASIGLALGVHPSAMSARLGHSTVSITLDVYSHLLAGVAEETAARIGDALAL